MPIDASIYDRLIQPLKQPESPLEIMQGVANLRDSQALAQERRALVQDKIRSAQEDGQIQQIMADPTADMPTKIQRVSGVSLKKGDDLQKSWDAHQENSTKLAATLSENAGRALGLYNPKDPTSWDHARAVAAASYQQAGQQVPKEYQDPTPPTQDTVDRWMMSKASLDEQIKAKQKSFETKEVLGPDGKTVTLQNFDRSTGQIAPVTDAQGQPAVSPKTADIANTAATQARLEQHQATQEGMERQRLGIEAAHLALAKKAAANEAITPQDMQAVKRTTLAGNDYIDMGDFEGQKERSAARAAAQAANIPVVDAKTGSSLKAVDTAKQNMMEQWRQISPYLAKDASGRIISGPENMLGKVFQTHPELGSIGAWRTAAIQQVQALAEPGMGLRITQAEIQQAMDNDIPQLTDDAPTAANRLKTLFTMLTHKENDALVRNRASLMPGATPAPATVAKNPFRK